MKAFLILLCFVSFNSLAEGIPVDSLGNILTDYIELDLTDNQKKQLEHTRNIELNEKQLSKVKHIWPHKFIDIVDPHHKDCTCGTAYAIWFTPNSIAFPIIENNIPESFEPSESRNLELFIGVNGELYFDNRKIETTNIPNSLKTKIKNRALLVFLPPFKENKNWNNVVQTQKAIENELKNNIKIVWM